MTVLSVPRFQAAHQFGALDSKKFFNYAGPQIETRVIAEHPLRIEIETSKRSRPENLQITADMARQVKGFRKGQYLPNPFQLVLKDQQIFWAVRGRSGDEALVPLLKGSEHKEYNWRYFTYFLEAAIRVAKDLNEPITQSVTALRQFLEAAGKNVPGFKLTNDFQK